MWYKKYTNTRHWKDLREAALKYTGYTCEMCGTRVAPISERRRSRFRTPRELHLVCHHMTYERLGEERMGDLAALCSICHVKIHNEERPPGIEIIYEPNPPSAVEKILRKQSDYYNWR